MANHADRQASMHKTYELLAHLNPDRIRRLFEGVTVVKPKAHKIRTGARVVIDYGGLDEAARHRLFAHGRFLT